MRYLVAVLILLSLSSAHARPLYDDRSSQTDVVDRSFYTSIFRALEKGDTERVFEQLKLVYGQLGVRFPEALALKLQPFDQALSGYSDDDLTITLSAMMSSPEQGLEYWKNWSSVLSDGLWRPEAHYSSQASMSLAGNFAILGILAHEMGHAIDYRYGLSAQLCQSQNSEPNQAVKELVADELALYVLKELAQDPRFASLLQQYEEKTLKSLQASGAPGKLRAIANPRDLLAYSLQNEVPNDNVGLYVSYQLARQRELLSGFNFVSFAQNLRSTVAAQETEFHQAIHHRASRGEVNSSSRSYPERSQFSGLFGTDVYPASGRAARWLMSSSADKELLLESRVDPRLQTVLNIAALVEWSQQQLGVDYPLKATAYQNCTSYLWDLLPMGQDRYQALVINRHRLTQRPKGPSDTALVILDYVPGTAPKVNLTVTIPRNASMSAALKQSVEGEVRLFLYRQDKPDQQGLLEIYRHTDGDNLWHKVSSTSAGFPTGGELRDGPLASQSYAHHQMLRTSLMTVDGDLVIPTQSTIKLLKEGQVFTLAGTSLRGNMNGSSQGQVCNEPELIFQEASGGIHFANKVRKQERDARLRFEEKIFVGDF
ncbi:hypothetical protein IV102_28415 [bacterium]|nr:hypothetical protein [bacterium]